ncbi:MAG: DNA polymerase-3 subunit beta [Bradymonadia bacterium]|jgi:DNA polymerase-3 subunit beta
MKITLDTATLTSELFKLQGIVSSKSTLPILHNALLVANADGTLELHATDLDISVSTRVKCEVESPGKMTVRARDLYDAVKNLRAEKVTLEREDNLWVRLTSGTVQARLVGMDPAEFPQIQEADEASFVTLRTASFMRLIDRTLFSVASDESRPNLTGALLRVDTSGNLIMVSTDGHRLSIAEMKPGFTVEDAPAALTEDDRAGGGVIVPRKGLAELRRTVDLTEEALSFGIHANSAVFRYGTTTLFVRLIDGTFPSFRQVVPEEKAERRATIDRAEFVGRLKFVSLFSSAKTHNITLKLEDSTLTVLAQDPDKGECEESIPVNYSGPAVKAGYNFKYLLDVLGVCASSAVSIEVIDTLSPTVVRELDGEDGEDALFIVMPMRL